MLFRSGDAATAAAITGNAVTGLSITTTSLPNGSLNEAYGPTTLQAQGGTSPYTWSATGLPAGLGLNAGVLGGAPSVGGSFNVTITVTDSSAPPVTVSKTYALSIALPPAPAFTMSVSGQPVTITDQPSLTLSLAHAYPLPLEATLALSFSPNAAGLPNAGYLPSGTYPGAAVQFASGGVSTTVSIGANSVTAPAPGIQVGDVAGTISVTLVSLQVPGGQTLQLPDPPPSVVITVPLLPPLMVHP